MSYAAVPRRGPFGFSGYNDLPGADPTKVAGASSYKAAAKTAASAATDASKAQAIAFAQQQLANYPSVAQVLSEYNQYAGYLKQIPNFNPADLQDPEKVAGLMKQALIIYAKANGYPTTTKEAEEKLAAYAASIALSEFGVSIPPNWPSNMKDLKSVAVDLACTAVVMETGVDPRSLTVVAESLMDGKLSPEECTAIGTAAGAIAGAIIGQSFGIPAPIGAFIGGLIGGDVGGTIGQIFGAGPSGTEEINARLAEQTAWANAQLSQANTLCDAARSSYWKTFDQLLLATELQWELAEQQIGWKFNLRWFGVETYTPMGQAFSHEWNPTNKNFTGAETYALRASRFGTGTPVETYAAGVDKPIRSVQFNYGCAFNYGCPYPPAPPGIPLPIMLGRDAAAFLARGARWLPREQRDYQCGFTLPDNVNLFDEPSKEQWLGAMQLALKQEQDAVRALQILSVTVIGDLVKTAATVAAEKKLNDLLKASTRDLAIAKIQRANALAAAKTTGKNLSDLLNYGAFVLGAGLLGAALWKKNR